MKKELYKYMCYSNEEKGLRLERFVNKKKLFIYLSRLHKLGNRLFVFSTIFAVVFKNEVLKKFNKSEK